MALNPRFRGQMLPVDGATTLHTIELFLDYVCPFSAKMFKTVNTSVRPLLQSKYPNKVRVIFRQQIQPWHPSSTLVHEAGAAILRLAPDKFWDFSAALMEQQKEYFDVNVVHEARNDTYKRLAKLSAESAGVKEADVFDLLRISDKPGEDGSLNTGNKVTDDMKVMVKANRLTGVHVTPTVLFNGVVEGAISSGMSGEEWEKWLEKNIT